MAKLNDPRWIELPVGKLVGADWNYKVEDPDQAEKLIANIKRNGQVENILVRELDTGFFEVINGNHRLAAFNHLGIKKAVCFNFGPITDSQAWRIAIETNETKFKRDDAKLAVLIKEMTSGSGAEFNVADLNTTMPFDRETLEGFSQMVDFDWNAFKKANDEQLKALQEKKDAKSNVTITVEATCPECGHKFQVSGKKK